MSVCLCVCVVSPSLKPTFLVPALESKPRRLFSISAPTPPTSVRSGYASFPCSLLLFQPTPTFRSFTLPSQVLTISLQEVEKRYSKPSKRKEESHDPPDSDSDLNLERARKSKKTKMLGDACFGACFFGQMALGWSIMVPSIGICIYPEISEMAMFLIIGSPFGRS